MKRRMVIYVAALCVLMTGCAVMALRHLSEARAAAETAAGDLDECQRYAGQIEHLRGRPTMAADRERLSAELSAPIERATREAGIPIDRLVRISPEPSRRVGDTAYKEKPTRVFLKNVRLKDVVEMAHRLTSAEAGLDLKSLRLTAPSRDATEGTWSAELVFTYFIYEPQRTQL